MLVRRHINIETAIDRRISLVICFENGLSCWNETDFCPTDRYGRGYIPFKSTCGMHGLWITCYRKISLRWRHNEHDSVSNHQPHHYLLNHLFGRRSKLTSKLRVTGLCVGNSPSPGPVNSPHKWPVTRKMFSFDDVIMYRLNYGCANREMLIIFNNTT